MKSPSWSRSRPLALRRDCLRWFKRYNLGDFVKTRYQPVPDSETVKVTKEINLFPPRNFLKRTAMP